MYLYGLGGPAGLRILNDSALVLNGINVYAFDPLAGTQVHLNSLFGPGDLRIPYDDGFLQLVPLDFQWTNNAGGDFNLGTNWSDGLVPLRIRRSPLEPGKHRWVQRAVRYQRRYGQCHH